MYDIYVDKDWNQNKYKNVPINIKWLIILSVLYFQFLLLLYLPTQNHLKY
jgi:hypothetical protein